MPRTGKGLFNCNYNSNIMNKRERTLIEGIYRDCLKLKRRKELTEFGEGQMCVCEMLLGTKKEDYLIRCNCNAA